MAYNQRFYGDTLQRGNMNINGILKITSSTYLAKLTTGSGAVAATPAGVIASTTRKKVKIAIDDVDYYLLAATDWVNSGSQSTSPSSSKSPSSSPSASVSPSASRSPSSSASASQSP
jgi:hypothetical protein